MRTLDEREIMQLKATLQQRGLKYSIEKLRVAIYARKSAEDVKDTSIPTQIAECCSFVSHYDFMEITYILQEDNKSGMFTESRTEYNKLMSMAENQEIDVIVVMKLDRLARDLSDAATAIKLLKVYGCHFLAGDDVASADTPAGEFARNILFAQNQYVARRTASDVMAAECNNARKGETSGGFAPYGLQLVAKRYEINEEQAPAVKLIFEKFAMGWGYQRIADLLEEQGYRTNAGRKFSATTLNAMLKNDKYYGTLVYNRIGGKRKKNRVLIENFDEIRTQDAIPAIISKDLFDKVQTIMQENSNKAKQYSHPEYVLTGLLVCKSCGKNMHGSTQHISKTKDKYRTYACPNHSSKSASTCKTKNIRAEYIETAIKDMITNSINDYINTSGAAQVYASMSKDISGEICKLKQRIAELDKKVSALLVKAASTSSNLLAQRYEEEAEVMLETKAKKETQIAELQASCSTMQTLLQGSSKATLTVEDIFTSVDVTRDLFRLFIDRIEVDDANDDISIVFK